MNATHTNSESVLGQYLPIEWGLGNSHITAVLIACLLVLTHSVRHSISGRKGKLLFALLFLGLGVLLVHTHSRIGMLAAVTSQLGYGVARVWPRFRIPPIAKLLRLFGLIAILVVYALVVLNVPGLAAKQQPYPGPASAVTGPGWGKEALHLLGWFVAFWICFAPVAKKRDVRRMAGMATGIWISLAVANGFGSITDSKIVWILPFGALLWMAFQVGSALLFPQKARRAQAHHLAQETGNQHPSDSPKKPRVPIEF